MLRRDLAFYFGYEMTVFAYLDPGTGSMLVQLVVGGAAAAGVAAKLYWQKILKFLHIRKDEPELGSSSVPDHDG
jgi:hypothetical protein